MREEKVEHDKRVRYRRILREMSSDYLRREARKSADEIQTNRPVLAALIDELVRRMR